VERLIASIRRECLDHLIVFNESSLRRTLQSYFDYYRGADSLVTGERCTGDQTGSTAGGRWLSGRRPADCITATNGGRLGNCFLELKKGIFQPRSTEIRELGPWKQDLPRAPAAIKSVARASPVTRT